MAGDQVMITTTDNPYSPFTSFDAWRQYDVDSGYYTCEYLARITRTSDELSFADQEAAIEDAIDEIVLENITGNYKKITFVSE